MEQENIRIGRERFFQGIFTTNANRQISNIKYWILRHMQTGKATSDQISNIQHWILRPTQLTKYPDDEYFKVDTDDQQNSWLSDSFHHSGTGFKIVTIAIVNKVNQYEDISGNQPFASAPDDLVTEVFSHPPIIPLKRCVRPLKYQNMFPSKYFQLDLPLFRSHWSGSSPVFVVVLFLSFVGKITNYIETRFCLPLIIFQKQNVQLILRQFVLFAWESNISLYAWPGSVTRDMI